jgi:Transglutaminase-like superfamily
MGLCLALLLGLSASLLPHFRDSAELVRMRNALLMDSQPATHDWTPDEVPAGFAVDRSAPSKPYADVVTRHSLAVPDDDWATALAIGQHLLVGGRRRASPIQSDLDQTYRRITQNGEGYCGDYADSFTGLAHAAGLFTRPWAFSFDGFGGRGHIFNEVWDRQQQRWIAIDVFNNLYFVDARGKTLSAHALRQALETSQPVVLMKVRQDTRSGFPVEGQALAYYRQGLDEWYMWWGTNVFEYDRSTLVRLFGAVSRAAEQLGGIAAGVHPRIRVLEVAANEKERRAMRGLQQRLMAIVLLIPIVVVLLCAWAWMRVQARRQDLPTELGDMNGSQLPTP